MSRLLDAKPNISEESFDSSLRRLSLQEYVGQKDLKKTTTPRKNDVENKKCCCAMF